MAPSWPQVLRALIAGADLDDADARWAMTRILEGDASEAQVAAFAVGLRAKGETRDEVAALAEVMLEHARRVELPADLVMLDVVGTGGDGSHSVNLSTMAALVAAACGATIAKHGNRAASSATGTADVLEQLGVAIDLEPELVARSIDECGFGFCFAPVFHPAMRFAAPARKAIGVPTVFNILGPLTNPAGARAALIGCADAGLAPVMAAVLAERGVCALVVRGDDGLDEMSTSAPTRILDTTSGAVVDGVFDPAVLGIPAHDPDLLRGADPRRNAAIMREVLGLDPVTDPKRIAAIRDAVALNAAAALAVETAARGQAPRDGRTADRIGDWFQPACDALTSGAAGAVLTSFIATTQRLRGAAAADEQG